MNHRQLVVYRSRQGSSRRYGEALAAQLGCAARESGQVRADEVAAAREIAVVGGVYAGLWRGTGWVKKWASQMADKRVAACFCGLTPAAEVDLAALQGQAPLPAEAAGFCLPGDFVYARLGPLYKGVIRLARKDLVGRDIRQFDLAALAPVAAFLRGEPPAGK